MEQEKANQSAYKKTFKLERLFCIIEPERFPIELRNKKISFLIKGQKYKEQPHWTHLIYLNEPKFDKIIVGGCKNRYNKQKDFDGFIYECFDFGFYLIPIGAFKLENEKTIVNILVSEIENKTNKYTHIIQHGYSLLGKCKKMNAKLYDELLSLKKEIKETKKETIKPLISFSPALQNINGRQTVKLNDD
jgi:hypothetical protein